MHHQILHTTESISSVRDEDAPSPQPLLSLRRDEYHDANLKQVQRATILHIALCIPRDFLSAARMWLSNAVYPRIWPSRKGSSGSSAEMELAKTTFAGAPNLSLWFAYHCFCRLLIAGDSGATIWLIRGNRAGIAITFFEAQGAIS